MLDEISTRWPLISDPVQFVLRYAPAVRSYLGALVKSPHDAEDVAQTFLMQAVDRPFQQDQIRSGRFRDYLKASLRNAAFTFFRQKRRQQGGSAELDQFPAPELESAADREWLSMWRNCLLQRAWENLEQHEKQAPAGMAYTVLRASVDHPTEDTPALVRRVEMQTGRSVRPEAFRKQLSRARRRFAQLLVDAVRQTLERPRPEDVLEELSDLGLMEYVRDHLPRRFQGPAH